MLRIFLVLLLTMTSVQAAHITDKLLVGLYAQPKSGIQPSKVLPSGTPLEVLERKDAYSKVRLGDGKEGWVKSVYISNEKPARAMLLELQAKTSTLQNKLREAEEKLKSNQPASAQEQSEQLKSLELELTQTKEKLALSGDALKNEQQETKRLMTLLKKSDFSSLVDNIESYRSRTFDLFCSVIIQSPEPVEGVSSVSTGSTNVGTERLPLQQGLSAFVRARPRPANFYQNPSVSVMSKSLHVRATTAIISSCV